MKNTKHRSKIIDILKCSNNPLTAEEIYDKCVKTENMNLSTIYRNLKVLNENDVIEKAVKQDGTYCYMLKDNKHSHLLICTKCKKCIKLYECPVYILDEKIEKKTGYKLQSHNLEMYGLCPKCRKNENV